MVKTPVKVIDSEDGLKLTDGYNSSEEVEMNSEKEPLFDPLEDDGDLETKDNDLLNAAKSKYGDEYGTEQATTAKSFCK
jgi:hypothetical protein